MFAGLDGALDTAVSLVVDGALELF